MADLYATVAGGVYHRSETLVDGVVADYDRDDNLIGIEINHVQQATFDTGGVVHISSADDADDTDAQ